MESSNTLLYSLVLGHLIGVLTTLLKFFRDLFITSVTIDGSLEYFQFIEDFFMEQKLLSANRIKIVQRRSKNMRLSTIMYGEITDETNGFGMGSHIIWYKWRLLMVEKSIEQSNGYEMFHIYVPFGTISFVQSMLNEIKENYKKVDGNINVNSWTDAGEMYGGGQWVSRFREGRTLASVILPKNVKQEILDDYKWFRNSEEWYKQRGIPYHRGYLLAGLPGTGKTSFSLALATEFGTSVYSLPIGALANSKEASKLINNVSSNSIVLIEDIDRISEIVERKNKDKSNIVTDSQECFRNLLQILDGVMTPHNVLFIITTNNSSSVDPALLRTGRIDRSYDFNYATKEQATEIFLQFFPGETGASKEFANNINDNIVMADIQEHLIRHVDDASKAKLFKKIAS